MIRLYDGQYRLEDDDKRLICSMFKDSSVEKEQFVHQNKILTCERLDEELIHVKINGQRCSYGLRCNLWN